MSSGTRYELATRRKETSLRFRWRWYDTLCLFLPFGWLILLNRHWNAYHKSVLRPAWAWYEFFFFLIPGGFYLSMGLRAVRERLARSPMPAQSPTSCELCGTNCIEDLTPVKEYPKRWSAELISVMGERYFRAEYQGLEKIPTHGPVIMMMNHAGMAFPWDFMVLGAKLYERFGSDPDFVLKAPGEKAFTRNKILNYAFPQGWTGTLGGVEATYANFEKIIKHRHPALYAPEGAKGMGKGFHKRYQLQHFHTSFLRLAAQYNVPLVPIICIGNEYLHPYSYDTKWLAKLLKFPFFGISPFSIWLLLFPSMLPWSLPAKLRYYVFDPVHLPAQDYSRFTDEDWQKLADSFRADMQEKIDKLLTQ
ncbi:1-acyl-sn-glycerol-3-phosphate acyltransferase [Candidatus Acetothermia bacterium]|nr:1-acyl-sn-glycerol-3-phosphate acyltransferase [Candidatus Acetothermia bacterium]